MVCHWSRVTNAYRVETSQESSLSCNLEGNVLYGRQARVGLSQWNRVPVTLGETQKKVRLSD